MKHNPDAHIVRKTFLEDCRVKFDLNISLSHFIGGDDKCVSIFRLNCGPVDAQIEITPEQCREFAAHLIAHAGEFEARRAAHEDARIIDRFEREEA